MAERSDAAAPGGESGFEALAGNDSITQLNVMKGQLVGPR